MKIFIASFFVCFVLLMQSCSVSKNYSPDTKYSKQQLQQDYTLLQNILQKKHPSLYWYTSKDSLDFLFNKYYAAIQDSMTEQQFGWKILAPLTHNIHCGHTSFMMSKNYNKWISNKTIPSIPLYFRAWNDSLIVTANLNRKDSVLKRGTVVTAINGFSSRKIIDSIFLFLTLDGYSQNINYARLSNNFPHYYRNVFGIYDQYNIEYKDSTGNIHKAKAPLFIARKDTSKKVVQPVAKLPKPTKKQRLENIRSMSIDSSLNTAIITLNTFSTGKLRRFFRQSFKQIKKEHIANVILDLRSNGGGKVNASTLLTKYVTRQPFKIADTVYAKNKSLKPYTKYIKGKLLNNIGLFFLTKKRSDANYHFGHWERKLFDSKKINHFDGQLYVLTAGQTFSASTLFCNAIKGQQGITLVGEEAGGGWYGNSGIMIPNITLPNTKLRVRLPLARLVQYKHVAKDGHGVLPDILVPPNYDALIKSYDKKLQTVKELIRQNQLNKN